MNASGWISVGLFKKSAAVQGRQPKKAARKNVPGIERLEQMMLMAVGCPVISGFVFLDQNTSNPALTNNGLLDPGEQPIGGATVVLLDSTGKQVGSTISAADGSYSFSGNTGTSTAATTQTQTLSIGNPAQNTVLTNFSNQPLSPALNLFDSTLGTLQSVTVSQAGTIKSNITSQNISQNSGANITATLSGNYQITGLNTALSGSASKSQGPVAVPPYDPNNPPPPVQFNLLATNAPPAITSTDPATLAFFTANANTKTITPLMSATGFATANSPNGNLMTTVMTSASSIVTVSYNYIPNNCFAPGKYTIVQVPNVPNVVNGKESQPGTVFPAPNPLTTPQMLMVNVTNQDLPHNDFAKLTPTPPSSCPTLGAVTRFGIHHQQTQLVLHFNGTVDPKAAGNPTNYQVVDQNGTLIAVTSATYNATTNSVTLTPARRLNSHFKFQLLVNLPCPTGISMGSIVTFGGKSTLGGYLNHQGQFVPFVDGHFVQPGAGVVSPKPIGVLVHRTRRTH